jgi:hypothetical protein
VCRAIAIATGKPYQEVYDAPNALGSRERVGKRKRNKSSARTGVYKDTKRRYLGRRSISRGFAPGTRAMTIDARTELAVFAESFRPWRLITAIVPIGVRFAVFEKHHSDPEVPSD